MVRALPAKSIALSAAAVLLASPVLAQSNLEKLSGFKQTGVTEFEVIEQGGDYADGIRETLKRIKMPAGFKIELYAIVPRRPPHGGRTTRHRHLRRHPQDRRLVGHRPQQGPGGRRGEALCPLHRLRHSQRALLLQGRFPLHRRAEPGAGLSGCRVLLREPRRGGLQRGARRAISSRWKRRATTTPPVSAASGRTTSSISRWDSLSTSSPKRRWTSITRPASAGSSG